MIDIVDEMDITGVGSYARGGQLEARGTGFARRGESKSSEAMEFLVLSAVLLVLSLVLTVDASWINVLFGVRNEMVFADRHKDYGAFVLRRDYNRRLGWALIGSLVFFSTGCRHAQDRGGLER